MTKKKKTKLDMAKMPLGNTHLKTIPQHMRDEHVGRNTLFYAIQEGKFPAKGIRNTWVVDTSHGAFQNWLTLHKERKIKYRQDETLAKARQARAEMRKEDNDETN